MSLDTMRVTWETPYLGDNQKLAALDPRYHAAKSGSGIEVWDVAAARPVALVAHKGDDMKAEAVFFSAATGEGEHSAKAVRHRIRQLIAAERPTDVLSDEAVAQKLKAEGIQVARRTVAKYREALRIPSSADRRRRHRAGA